MTDDVWNDTAREELRERLRLSILGELRLARYDHQGILELICDRWMQDVCPPQEWPAFLQFASEELDRQERDLAAEMTSWPAETDGDRLDRVESTLRDRGILLWQASPCCDSCTRAELFDRIEQLDRRFPGLIDRIRGYAFFIDQNLPEMLAESRRTSIDLGYGWIVPADQQVSDADYAAQSLGIAREVCECLRSEGLAVDWNGSLAWKIHVTLCWQRRTLLE